MDLKLVIINMLSGFFGVLIGGLITYIIQNQKYQKEQEIYYKQKRENIYLRYLKSINEFYEIADPITQLCRLDLCNSPEEELKIITEFKNFYISILSEIELFCNNEIKNKFKEIYLEFNKTSSFSFKQLLELEKLFKKDLGIIK